MKASRAAMLERFDCVPLFFAPFVSSVMRIEPQWIDYNGHLNMAYYTPTHRRLGRNSLCFSVWRILLGG
jgi:acyl-CoA thioester hydrolase